VQYNRVSVWKMHGRKRAARAAVSKEDLDIQREKFGKLRKLSEIALQCYKAKDYSEKSFNLTTKLLSINPDFHTLWNYRRIILKKTFSEALQHSEVDNQEAQIKNLIEAELKLTADCIANRNPKSYSSWYHRRWIVEHFGRNSDSKNNHQRADLKSELALCTKFLSLDERNFHCWNYRSFILKEKGFEPSDEIDFTNSLIERNFSNYSAWHRRTLFLDTNNIETLKGELEFVSNAIFTEPADQSCWIYHRWLISRVVSVDANPSSYTITEDRATAIREQFIMCQELLELEANSKWAMFAQLFLLQVMVRFGIQVETVIEPRTEAKNLCLKLKDVDPLHSNYYDFVNEQIAL